MQSMSPYTRTLYRYFDTLVLRNGVLYRMFLRTDGTAKYYQLIVPYVLKRQVYGFVSCGCFGTFAIA